jgi:hypothetical protein
MVRCGEKIQVGIFEWYAYEGFVVTQKSGISLCCADYVVRFRGEILVARVQSRHSKTAAQSKTEFFGLFFVCSKYTA